MLEKGTRPGMEKEGNETRSKWGGTVCRSIKSNPMLRGDMDHDVRTGGRNKQLVFFAVVIFFLKVICFYCKQRERPNKLVCICIQVVLVAVVFNLQPRKVGKLLVRLY